MENLLVPYQCSTSISATRVWVLAPHPDDEVFGCGGAIIRHLGEGVPVRVAILSDGAFGLEGKARDDFTGLRREESRAAAEILGYGSPQFFDWRDREIHYGETLVRFILDNIQDADLIYAPSVFEMHPDHRALGMAAVEAVRRIGKGVALALYEIGIPLRPNLLLDISAVAERKMAAMRCFASQLEQQRYDLDIAALNRYRTFTLPADVSAAEAFLLTGASEIAHDPFLIYQPEHKRQQQLGLPLDAADVPLVSIVVRSMDRPTLSDALDSVALQTYTNIEVVLVNALGDQHRTPGSRCGRFPLRFIQSRLRLSRGRAANAGLHAARGDFILFLDDDDWIDADHIGKLRDALRRHPEFQVAYTGVRCVDESSVPMDHDFVYEYDSLRLLTGNVIPIHAVLFSRSLLDAGLCVDESLEMYEDWDFWIQASRSGDFLFVPGISAVYRVNMQSDSGVHLVNQHRDGAALAVYQKWIPMLAPAEIFAVMHTAQRGLEMQKAFSGLQASRDELAQALEQANTGLLATSQQLKQANTRLLATSQQLEQANAGLLATSQQWVEQCSDIPGKDHVISSLGQSLAERDATIHALCTSTSWRLTRPVRYFGRQLLRSRLLFKSFSLSVSQTGSFRASFVGFVRILAREGLSGVRARLRFLLEAGAYRKPIDRPPTVEHVSTPGKEVVRHQQNVDIVVCVHNALDDVARCLESILQNTHPPYRLIIVDDGSGDETKSFLENFVVGQGITLLRSETATGYTLAANRGLRAATGDFVILLNSDTVVSPLWLDRLVQCADSAERIGMVGPLSNTASWQSVPEVFDTEGDWASNPLAPGQTVGEFAFDVAAVSARIYPRVGFLNGFCVLIKRALIDDIGHFDEETFAKGYGEENDFALRATSGGWELAVADDCYVYHAQSKSYSHEKRLELAELAGEALARKHSPVNIARNLSLTKDHPALLYVRRRCQSIPTLRRLGAEALNRFEGKKVLFLLPAMSAGGGGNIVLLEAACMRELGIDAWFANLESNRVMFEANHPHNRLPGIYLRTPADLLPLADDFDAIIATLFLTVEWLKPLQSLPHPPVLGYYVQDFEPDFFDPATPNYKAALDSYTAIPGMRIFTKTAWNKRALSERLPVDARMVGASLDIDRFHPAAIWHASDGVVRILAMVRPSTPRRAPGTTMRILKRLAKRFGERVSISIFGVHPNDPAMRAYPCNFPHHSLGELDSPSVASVMSATDIFIDCSVFQAMGLTALEAMASGVAVVGPLNGGLGELIVDGENGLLIDTRDEDAIFNAVSSIVSDDALRARLQRQAFRVLDHSPVITSFNILDLLFAVED